MIDSITSCIFWTYENSEMRQIIQEKQAQLTIYPIYGWCINMDVITSSIILLLHLQIHRICQLYRNWSIHKKLSFPLHTFAILVKLSYEAKISLVVLNKGIEWNGWQFCRFRIHIISLKSVSSRRIYVISDSSELYKSFNKQWNSNGAQESHSWPFPVQKKRIAIHPHSPPQMHKKPWLRNQRISSIFSDFSFIKYTFHSSLFLYPSHYRMFSTVARSTARLANVCRPNLSRSFYAMMRNSQMSPSLLPRQTNSSVYIQKRYFMGNIMRVAIQVISSTFSASVRAFLSAFQQQAGISLSHLSPSILHPMSIPSTICWFSLILTNRVFSICSPFLSHPFFS